jgi:hypothetical protein
MSLSTVLYIALCAGLYKLGVFNAMHPGHTAALLKDYCRRGWQWLHQEAPTR